MIENCGCSSFVLGGAPEATPLPTLGAGSLILMGLGMFALAGFMLARRHRSGTAALLMLALLPPGADAQTDPEPDRYVQVLLSTETGAPTAEELVNYFAFSPVAGPTPLEAFNAVAPVAAGYLLPLRATGDFLAYLQANPATARATLERYLLIAYAPESNIETALSSLRADPYVSAAHLSLESSFSSVSLVDFGIENPGAGLPQPLGAPTQYGWDALNIAAAWQLAGGYALIGSADTGWAVGHPALRQFSATGQYLGGNVNPGSLDFGGWPTSYDADVNEVTPMPLGPNSFCNPDHIPNYAPDPVNAGHGTHVAGLQAANAASGLGVKGTCKNCGVAMWKVARNICSAQTARVELSINGLAMIPAITVMADTGVQIINLSLGSPGAGDYCDDNAGDPYCVALAHATNRDVVIVASSGNHRTNLQFPARDSRVVAAGGFDSNLALWDESPGSTTFCPNPANSNECGSNYTLDLKEPKQELMASSKPFSRRCIPQDWVPTGLRTPSARRLVTLGLCTGTSMSTPQISGVAASCVRSIRSCRRANPFSALVMCQVYAACWRKPPWKRRTICPGLRRLGTAARMPRPQRLVCSARFKAER